MAFIEQIRDYTNNSNLFQNNYGKQMTVITITTGP